jgi:hypothetical protein
MKLTDKEKDEIFLQIQDLLREQCSGAIGNDKKIAHIFSHQMSALMFLFSSSLGKLSAAMAKEDFEHVLRDSLKDVEQVLRDMYQKYSEEYEIRLKAKNPVGETTNATL